jgi:hypothetical protein
MLYSRRCYIKEEWEDINEILKGEDHSIQNQVALLQTKIVSEGKFFLNFRFFDRDPVYIEKVRNYHDFLYCI